MSTGRCLLSYTLIPRSGAPIYLVHCQVTSNSMSNVKCPLSSSKLLRSGAHICPSVCCKDTAHSSSTQIPKARGTLCIFCDFCRLYSAIKLSISSPTLVFPPLPLLCCPPPPTEPFWAPLVQGLQCVISMLDKYYAYLLPGRLY